MSSNDFEYYSERVSREREMAAGAGDPRAAAANGALADVYEAMLAANNQRPTARILRPDFQWRRAEGRDQSGPMGANAEGQ